MEEVKYINQPGIQYIMYFIIFVVVGIIIKLFFNIKQKKEHALELINNQGSDIESIKLRYYEKIQKIDYKNQSPKSIFFLLEMSLKYYKEELSEKEIEYYEREFQKIRKEKIEEEDIKLIKKYYQRIM